MNIYRHNNNLIGHTDLVTCLLTLPNSELASGSWDNSIIIWNLNNNLKKAQLREH